MVVLDLHGAMVTFALISIVGAMFIIVFQPETKGKTSVEIVKLLEK